MFTIRPRMCGKLVGWVLISCGISRNEQDANANMQTVYDQTVCWNMAHILFDMLFSLCYDFKSKIKYWLGHEISFVRHLVTRVFLTGMWWQQGSENKDMVMSAEKWICFGVRASYDILMIYFYIWIMCQIIHNKSRSICELWLYVAFQGISWMLMWQNQAHIFGRSTSSGSNIPAVMYWLPTYLKVHPFLSPAS